MTEVKFFKKDNSFVGFVSSGHACYAKHGKDVVCAAISTIIQASAIGIVNVLGIDAIVDKNEKIGFFRLELPKNISGENLKNAQIIFQTLFLSVKNLEQGYSNHIKLEEINYDN